MASPDSLTSSLVGILEEPLSLPKYQRDFAWDAKQMSQLWEDLLYYLFRNEQKGNDDDAARKSSYFLGAIVRDLNSRNKENFLVDGQQRFSTLLLISSGLRDALISNRFYEIAHDLQNDLIMTLNARKRSEKRFTLLDNPKGKELSSEVRIRPYRTPLVNIRTGMITEENPAGSLKINLKGAQLNWTLPLNTNWTFMLWDESQKKWYSDEIFTVESMSQSAFSFQFGNTPNQFSVSEPTTFDIPEGLEIILIPDIKYPGDQLPMSPLTDADLKKNLNQMDECDIFDAKNREFYLKVRLTAEHFIRGYKEFQPKGGINRNEDSTGLEIVQSAEGGIPRSGRELKKEEEVIFEELNWVMGWPTTEQIKDIIQKGENRYIEFKSSWIHRALGTDHEYNIKPDGTYVKPPLRKSKVPAGKKSKLMSEQCAIAINSMMNAEGGLVLIGVKQIKNRVAGSVVGINRDFIKPGREFDEDGAVHQIVEPEMKKYFASHIQFVDFKPYKVDEINWIMVCKVRPFHGPRKEIKATKNWSEFEGMPMEEAKKQAFRRGTGRTTKMDEEESKEMESLVDYFVDIIGMRYENNVSEAIKHRYKINRSSISIPKTISSTSSLLTSEPRIYKKRADKIERDIPRQSICKINYLSDKEEWPSYLNSPEGRAEQLSLLIRNTSFTDISFDNKPVSALNHFMLTNDPKRVSPLNAYDLMASMTQKILLPEKEKEGMNDYQEKIEEIWKDISDVLYIGTKKDESKINDYFSAFLLATERTKSLSQRYTKNETWEGLEKEFMLRTNKMDGKFHYKELLDFYKELGHYIPIFIRATDHNSELWKDKPYVLAECRDEHNFLYMLNLGGCIQFQPAYMALVDTITEKKGDRKIIREFLKNATYLWLRMFMLKAIIKDRPTLVSGQDIYGKMTGSNSWIRKIRMLDVDDEDAVIEIQRLPLTIMEKVDKKLLDRKIPWEKHDPLWLELNYDGPLKSREIKYLLVAAERALEKIENPPMPHLHGHGNKVQVEHVLPKDAKKLDARWFDGDEPTEAHDTLKYHFGNHCLLPDSLNSKARNKPPTEKLKDLRDKNSAARFATTSKVIEIISSAGDWSEKEMAEYSKFLMGKIIDFYDVK